MHDNDRLWRVWLRLTARYDRRVAGYREGILYRSGTNRLTGRPEPVLFSYDLMPLIRQALNAAGRIESRMDGRP